MPVNSAYRDFLKALDAMEQGADPWRAYQQLYLEPNREVLLAYWRQCWGADESRLPEIAAGIRPGDYRALRVTLGVENVEELVRQALNRCAALVDAPEPQVDLLIGRFSPDAFLFEVAGRWHIGIGLERFAHFAALPLFIAHEYGHYVRRLLASEPKTLGDRIIAEGIAIAFAEAAYPEQRLARHLRMSPRRLHEIQRQESELWTALAPYLAGPDEDAFAGVISGARRWMGFPPRFGGYLGYLAVRGFAQGRSESPASRRVLSAPAEEIIAAYDAAANNG